MLILWQWLQIFSLKGLVKAEAKILIKEAMLVDFSMVVIIILVLLLSMVGICLNFNNPIKLDLQDFRGNQVIMDDFRNNQVIIKYHNARFMERVAIQLLTATIGCIFLFKEDMLHQNW